MLVESPILAALTPSHVVSMSLGLEDGRLAPMIKTFVMSCVMVKIEAD